MADISDLPQRTKARIRPRSVEPLPKHIRTEIIEATKNDKQYAETEEDSATTIEGTDLIPKGKSLVANIHGTIVKLDPMIKNYRASNFDLLKHEMKQLIKDVLHKLEINVPLQTIMALSPDIRRAMHEWTKGWLTQKEGPPQRNMQIQTQANETKRERKLVQKDAITTF